MQKRILNIAFERHWTNVTVGGLWNHKIVLWLEKVFCFLNCAEHGSLISSKQMTVAGKLLTLTKYWAHFGWGCLGFKLSYFVCVMCVHVCVWMDKNSYLINWVGSKCNTRYLCYNSVSILGIGLNCLVYNLYDSNGWVFYSCFKSCE